MKRTPLLAAIMVASLAAIPAFAQTSGGVAADNSASNKADVHQDVSADAQKNDATDLSLTRRIRRSVLADKSLSTDAHNVKIVSLGGQVTLNGVVASDEEKAAIHAKAVSIAGEDHIVDRMTVAPPKS